MQIKIFTLPLVPDAGQAEELNHFLRANKIIDIRKEIVPMDGNSVWTFCVTYLQSEAGLPVMSQNKVGKIDYKEVLDEHTFARFSTLRRIRKELSEKDAVPAYSVFTDAELAELARLEELTPKNMLSVPGIGKKKVEKYADAFLEKLKNAGNETGGVFDREDSGFGQFV